MLDSYTSPNRAVVQDHELSGLTLDDLILEMMRHNASDLHINANASPMVRVHGKLIKLQYPPLTSDNVQAIVYGVLSDAQITRFEQDNELDLAYTYPTVARFRGCLYRQRGLLGAVFRVIPQEMPTLESLNMPEPVHELTLRPRGLVLVTGPTGSGKSTTLAAMIDQINITRPVHIVTIEEPIEFVHRDKMAVITQREVGIDTSGFAIALRQSLRQDPDVIMIGEMRDLETIAAAVTAAETGHLVLATLHTTSAAQTIDRIIDVFPPHQQGQIRSQLSNVLEGIITQALLPRTDGHGLVCAQEIIVCTAAIRNLIREGKVYQIPSVIQQSGKYGMQTLDASLAHLVKTNKVTLDEAKRRAFHPDDLETMLGMI